MPWPELQEGFASHLWPDRVSKGHIPQLKEAGLGGIDGRVTGLSEMGGKNKSTGIRGGGPNKTTGLDAFTAASLA